MNGTLITTGGEVIFIAHDLGSYYRYDGKTLEYQPIHVSNGAGGIQSRTPVEDEWEEIDEWLVDQEPCDWEGKETILKDVYTIIKRELNIHKI